MNTTKCRNEWCDKTRIQARGLCHTHYRRLQRGGDAMGPPVREKAVVEVGVCRLPPVIAAKVFKVAHRRGISVYALLQEICGEWATEHGS